MSETKSSEWFVRGRVVLLNKPFVVGILNTTPDSFSDGAEFESVDRAVEHVRRMIAEGADAIDVGGESTRPQGAQVVSDAEEQRRVLPVLRAVRREWPELLISVDTTKSEVAKRALDEGADIVNDVSGFRLDPRMGEIVARADAGVVLMHSRGGVSDMATYAHADYSEVVSDVVVELEVAVDRAISAGVRREAIVVDPGVGFAKRTEHSLTILSQLAALSALGRPVMVGASRKRFVGELSRVSVPRERVSGTLGANVAALMRGARLFRVHDVAENRQALDVAWGVLSASGDNESQFRGSRFPVPGSPS